MKIPLNVVEEKEAALSPPAPSSPPPPPTDFPSPPPSFTTSTSTPKRASDAMSSLLSTSFSPPAEEEEEEEEEVVEGNIAESVEKKKKKENNRQDIKEKVGDNFQLTNQELVALKNDFQKALMKYFVSSEVNQLQVPVPKRHKKSKHHTKKSKQIAISTIGGITGNIIFIIR
jgi:hypothetical protein